MENDYYEVNIHTPVPGTMNEVSISLGKLREAFQNHQQIKVTILANKISAIVDPKWWFDTGWKEKVMKKKKTPLVLIHNHVPVPGQFMKNKLEIVDQLRIA